MELDILYKAVDPERGNFDGWYLTFDFTCYIDSYIAKQLHIPLSNYIEILQGCNGKPYYNKYHKGYVIHGFKNKEDAEKALVALKLIMS